MERPIRGQLEANIQKLTQNADEAQKNGEVLWVFIDEIHLLPKLGANADNPTATAGNMLKGALARSNIRVIGSTTPAEVDNVLNFPAFERRFAKMYLKTDSSSLLGIMSNQAKKLSQDAKKMWGVDIEIDSQEISKLKDEFAMVKDQAWAKSLGSSPDMEISVMDLTVSRLSQEAFENGNKSKVKVTLKDLYVTMLEQEEVFNMFGESKKTGPIGFKVPE